MVPLEVHAYWRLAPAEVSETFEMRFVLVAPTGLETSSDVFKHRSVTDRFRTRTLGLPYPPVKGGYELRVDWRLEGAEDWNREGPTWPVGFAEVERKPRIVN
jgi:hypothetical protein